MIVLEEAHNIAVTIGKGENLRVTASRMFAAVMDYILSPRNGGAQQVIEAGYEPNVSGVWKMITADPAWPKEVGTSMGTARRLLGIGRAPDPETADQANREYHREYHETVTKAPSSSTNCNRDLGEWREPPHEVDEVEVIKTRIKQLSTEPGKRLFVWHVGEARALGWVK